GTHTDIHRMIERETGTTDWFAVHDRTDEVLSEVCRLYLTSGNPYVILGILRDYASYATENVTFPLIDLGLDYSRESYADFHEKYPEEVRGVRLFTPGKNDPDLRRCEAFADSPVLRFWSLAGPYCELVLLGVVLALAVVGGAARLV